MKKLIVVLAFVLLPIVSHAEVDKRAGVEFLSPLVQQIVQLLYDRIHELSAEIESVKRLTVNDRIRELEIEVRDLKLTNQSLRNTVQYEQSKPTPQCPQFGAVKSQAEIDRENKIASLKQQILEISLTSNDLQKEYNRVNSVYAAKGSGVTAFETSEWNREIRRLNDEMVSLNTDRQRLQAQLNAVQ